MKDLFGLVLGFSIMLAATGCSDSNSRIEHGESGLPVNCRAYVQDAVANYEAKVEPYKYTVLDTNYYCEPNDWYSSSCRDHLQEVGDAAEVRDAEIKILTESLLAHCGYDGDLWPN